MSDPVWSVQRLRACRAARLLPPLPEGVEEEAVAILEAATAATRSWVLQSHETSPQNGACPAQRDTQEA